MPRRKHPPQSHQIGRLASRLLTIPVMAMALLASYVLLRSSSAAPASMAEAAPALMAAPSQARSTATRAAPAAQDAAILAHEVLDPVGAGRSAAR